MSGGPGGGPGAGTPASPAGRGYAGAPAPDPDCPLCPRLTELRARMRVAEPLWHNAPVPTFGDAATEARLLIVGLAPGLKGAGRTGRPFTGDYAGDLLYDTLLRFGFARGAYGARPDDGLRLVGCRLTNAVRCVPPENKPTAAEIAACRPYLEAEIAALSGLRAILALGRIAHDSVLRALGERPGRRRFAHGARHDLPPSILPNRLLLVDSYHCSRYNTNTGRLTEAMFHAVFHDLRTHLG